MTDNDILLPPTAGGVSGDQKHKGHSKAIAMIGPEVYVKFVEQVEVLDKKLRDLCHEARKLGSAVGILSASTRLRYRLGRVSQIFHKNAVELYPEALKGHIDSSSRLPLLRRWKHNNFLNHLKQNDVSIDEPLNLALEFNRFSDDVEALFTCFVQYPQFVEDLPTWSLAEELRVWAQSLHDFRNEYQSQAVQQYLFDSMADIGMRLERFAQKYIAVFTKIGIPAVRSSQDRARSNLANQTIISSLFASTTASMLQVMSGGSIPHGVFIRVGTILWYMALIFSISSGINSLLGLSWVQAIYRSPDHRVPWWVKVWIRRFPLVSLVLSTACFFLGLIFFVYASPRDTLMAIFITAFSSLSSFGLILTSGWFTCELLVYTRYEGRVWLADIVSDVKASMREALTLWWSTFWTRNCSQAKLDPEVPHLLSAIGRRNTDPWREDQVSFWLAHQKDAFGPKERARHRWHEAVRRLIIERRKQYPRTAIQWSHDFAHLTFVAMDCMRYNSIDKLRRMTVSQHHQVNERHDALVRCLQFSPDGEYLLTSSWDSSSYLLRVGRPALCESFVKHSSDFGFIHQVEWSRDGQYILARSNRKLVVWKKNIENSHASVKEVLAYPPVVDDNGLIRRAAWDGNSKTLFVVKDGKVLTMGLDQIIQRDYTTRHLRLRDICVTADSNWMICVGKFIKEDEHHLQKHGIIVWNLKHREVAKRVLVFHDVNNVALARDDTSILVSYENKAPSQCWKLCKQANVDLVLRHTYMPQVKTCFAALPSIFGGENDHLVLRAAAGGSVYIWDRDSAALVHHIPAPSPRMGELTSFAWNRGSKGYMFATGTHEGTVHIWTLPSEDSIEIPEQRTSRRLTGGSDELTLVSTDFVAGH